MSDLQQLRTANTARQKEWDTGAEPVSLSYRSNELAGETGELCNIVKKLERERIGIKGSRATIDQAAAEMADVLICLDNLAMQLGVDLWAATVAKFNATSERYGFETRLGVTMAPAEWPHPDGFAGGVTERQA